MAPDGDEVIRWQQLCDEVRHELLKAASCANAMANASASPLGVLHPPKTGKHFCSAEIIVHASIDDLFSASMRRLDRLNRPEGQPEG